MVLNEVADYFRCEPAVVQQLVERGILRQQASGSFRAEDVHLFARTNSTMSILSRMRKAYASETAEKERAEAEQAKKREQLRQSNLRQLRAARVEGDATKVREITDSLLQELDELRSQQEYNELNPIQAGDK